VLVRVLHRPFSLEGQPIAVDVSIGIAVAPEHGVPQAVTYGHAGNGHPHQNFIANDAEELARINAVVNRTIATVLELGGTVAAEHGLGKLKRHWLRTQLSATQVDVMQALKNVLDPHGLFAPGNVL
jgi:FAD/FMN-containing dehydrogenase